LVTKNPTLKWKCWRKNYFLLLWLLFLNANRDNRVFTFQCSVLTLQFSWNHIGIWRYCVSKLLVHDTAQRVFKNPLLYPPMMLVNLWFSTNKASQNVHVTSNSMSRIHHYHMTSIFTKH
jgi:hypothetical protein